MKPVKRGQLAFALACMAMLGACAWLPNAETPAQRLAIVDAQFTALVETAVDTRAAGGLTEAEINRLTPIILRGNAALNAAWGALTEGEADDSELQQYINVATALLVQLKGIVEANGGQL